MSVLIATVMEAPIYELVSRTSATFSKTPGATEEAVVARSGGGDSEQVFLANLDHGGLPLAALNAGSSRLIVMYDTGCSPSGLIMRKELEELRRACTVGNGLCECHCRVSTSHE